MRISDVEPGTLIFYGRTQVLIIEHGRTWALAQCTTDFGIELRIISSGIAMRDEDVACILRPRQSK